MKLRPYQQQVVDNVIDELKNSRSTLVVLPTGGGKTVCFAHLAKHYMQQGRVMVIAHREELIRQAANKIEAITGYRPAIEMAIERSDEEGFEKPKIVAASVQTLVTGRVTRFKPEEFSLVITDECFPAGTMVDGRPIETIVEGDMVDSFNHQTGNVERRMVTKIMRNKTWLPLVTVKLKSGRAVTCTPNHPFWNGVEYVPAMSLHRNDMVHTIMHHDISQDMRMLRPTVSGNVQSNDVFARVPEQTSPVASITSRRSHGELHRVQCQVHRDKQESQAAIQENGSGVLLAGVLQSQCGEVVFSEDVSHEFEARRHDFKANETQEPDVSGRCEGGGIRQAAGDVLEAHGSRRQRAWNDDSRASVCCGDWMESGSHSDQNPDGQRVSDIVQDRRGQRSTKSCGRDRRQQSSCVDAENSRSQERRVLEVDWVESVSVHELPDRIGLDGLREPSVVFNLTVEGNHNYFAEGILVHNCHHCCAESYKKVYEHMIRGKVKHLGVTATPDRADEQALGQIFETVAFDYELPQIIEDGWLVPIRQKLVVIEGLDYSHAKTTAGDLNQADVAKAQANEEILHSMIAPIIELAGTRKTIVFATPGSKKTEDNEDDFHIAQRMTEILNRYRPDSARRVSQETPKVERRQLLQDFAEGRFQFLVNVGVLTEGFDDPSIEIVAITRPTKSRSLYAQMIGRGTRPLPGTVDGYDTPHERRHAISTSAKSHVEILDFVGNSGRHKLVTTAEVLGGKYSDEVVERAKKKAAESDEAVDMGEMLEEAVVEVKEEQRAKLRAAVLAKAKYTAHDVDPFDVFDLHPEREREWNRGRVPTVAQLQALARAGIPTKNVTSRSQASALLQEEYRRRDEGLVGFRHLAAGADKNMTLKELNQDRFKNWSRKFASA